MAQRRGPKGRAREGQKAQRAVAAMAEPRGKLPAFEDVELQSGAVLRCKGVPPFAQLAVIRLSPRPEPPRIKLDSGQEEVNLTDPDYAIELDVWQVDVTRRTNEATVLLGTDIVSLPDGMIAHDADGWAEPLEALGVTIRDDQFRYVDWVQLYLCQSRDDVRAMQDALDRLSGVREVEVEAAEAIFPSGTERPADQPAPAAGDDK